MAGIAAIPLFVFRGGRPMGNSFHYGGQALIEGVMMRGPRDIAMAVRLPDGQLDTTRKRIPSIYNGRFRKLPLFRGMLVLLETLIIGTQALMYSAEKAATGEEGQELPKSALIGAVVLSLGFSVVLFFIVPLLITRSLDAFIVSDFVSNLIEGVVRIALFVLYVALIGLMPDIKRVFAYHGAEHRVINAYEAGLTLTPRAVQHHSTSHSRCGTSFIFVVLVISILVHAVLGRPPVLIAILSRVILLPLIAAVSYEIIKWSADRQGNLLVRSLTMPGLLLQKLVTRPPDDGQVEAAIAALQAVLDKPEPVPEPA
ncbi:MAG: DUF1385 domain-containing protein [Dehalococcoidia bacterium]|nr:DUF1385 domain-containing protein [Dehalococcoidia bacterium]